MTSRVPSSGGNTAPFGQAGWGRTTPPRKRSHPRREAPRVELPDFKALLLAEFSLRCLQRGDPGLLHIFRLDQERLDGRPFRGGVGIDGVVPDDIEDGSDDLVEDGLLRL